MIDGTDSKPFHYFTIRGEIDSAGFEPFHYETDEQGAIKAAPEPELNFFYSYNGLPLELLPLLSELMEIKSLLKQTLETLNKKG